MKQKPRREPSDFGTPQIAQRLSVVPKRTASGDYLGKIVDETEIDRLLLHDRISAMEHSILEALMRRLYKANFVGLRSPSWEAPVQSDPTIMADKKANQIRSMVRIIEQMDEKMGRTRRSALVNLVLMDAPWPEPPNKDGELETLHGVIDTLQDILARR